MTTEETKATGLKEFLSTLATDPLKLGEFLHEPEAAMSAANLSEADKVALRSGVAGMVGARLAGVALGEAFMLLEPQKFAPYYLVTQMIGVQPLPQHMGYGTPPQYAQQQPPPQYWPPPYAQQQPPQYWPPPPPYAQQQPPQYWPPPPQYAQQQPPQYWPPPPQYAQQPPQYWPPPPQYAQQPPYYPR